jgi:hypothetical protein
MSTKQKRGLPARLEAVRRRIDHWRLARKARSRIPDSLWASAVKMARTYVSGTKLGVESGDTNRY